MAHTSVPEYSGKTFETLNMSSATLSLLQDPVDSDDGAFSGLEMRSDAPRPPPTVRRRLFGLDPVKLLSIGRVDVF